MNYTVCLGILVLLCISTAVRSRSVDESTLVVDNNNNTSTENDDTLSDTRETLDASTLFDGLQLAGFSDRNSLGNDNEVNERTFEDLVPYFGSVIFRGIVRRTLIKPMVRGMKKLVPKSFYQYYNEVLAQKRVFQLMSPLSPAISTYAYSKFEQGIFWGIKRGYGYVVDNFIEFEERKKRS